MHIRSSKTGWTVYQLAMAWTFIIPLLMLVILLWLVQTRIREFEHYHHDIAQTTVKRLAEDIGALMSEQQYQVQIFTEDHAALIALLAKQPANEAIYAQLHSALKREFPDLFSFTIADPAGKPYLTDFDGYVGDICINDMQEFVQTGKINTRIHPNNFVYHFDAMGKWQTKHGRGLLLVSFKPELISRLLRAANPSQHELMLINHQQQGLMEITLQGARNMLQLEDYRLDDLARRRIMVSENIRNTAWQLIDLHQPDLFENYKYKQYRAYGLIWLGFALLAGVAMTLFRKLEQQRITAENLKAEMFSLFSHDLRSPLVALRGGLDLLYGKTLGELTPNARHLVSLLKENTGNMQRLVDDILDMHKLESGTIQMTLERIGMKQLISKTVELNQEYARQFDVSVKSELIDEDVFCMLDEQRMMQALTNLISNAIKVSPASESVIVKLSKLHNGVAVIEVCDHGPGIPEQYRPYIFEKFFQLKQNTQQKVASTGLGLTIVKHIITQLGGSVRFETHEGQGTCFIIELTAAA